MATMPEPVERLLDAAHDGELTVVRHDGRPITYPLIPLWDGERVYLTSSTLFSRKLEHLSGNPRVSLSITDPVAVGGLPGRVTRPGDVQPLVLAEDPQQGMHFPEVIQRREHREEPAHRTRIQRQRARIRDRGCRQRGGA